MRRTLFKSKIHRANVTHADLQCEAEAWAWKPTVVLVDRQNRPVRDPVVETTGPERPDVLLACGRPRGRSPGVRSAGP